MANLSDKEEKFLKLIEERNNQEYDKDNLPASVEIAIEKLIEQYEDLPVGVQSQSISDLRETFFEGIDPKIVDLLNMTRKVSW